MKKVIAFNYACKSIFLTILIFGVLLSSCSKEDDLLTPVPTTPTNTTNTDTTVITNGNNGTTTLEHTPNENLVVDNEFVNYTTADLEGSKWRVTYNSFYLNNRFPICPMPYDTIISEEWYNMGEVYFSNQGDGYLETHTYLVDCAPFYGLNGQPVYEPLLNYTPNPNFPQNPLLKQDYVDYTIKNNEIIVNVVSGVAQWEYTITLQIVEQTNNTLILENNNGVHSEYTNAQGYPTDWDRNVRLELEKIN